METGDLTVNYAVLGQHGIDDSDGGRQEPPTDMNDVRKFNSEFGPDPKTGDGSQRAITSGGSITINGVTIGGSNDPAHLEAASKG